MGRRAKPHHSQESVQGVNFVLAGRDNDPRGGGLDTLQGAALDGRGPGRTEAVDLPLFCSSRLTVMTTDRHQALDKHKT